VTVPQKSLNGRVAIITGGGTGLGAAISRGLAGRGAFVVVNYSRSAEEAVAVVEEIKRGGGEAIAVKGDVSEDADCRQVAAAPIDRWGRIDILINNAARATRVAAHDDLEALEAEDFLATCRVNVIGPYQMTRACRPAMKTQGYGAVVNISSSTSLSGSGSSIAYTVSKGALNTMTQSLARALAPEIRVNAVCPGFMETRWFADSFSSERFAQIVDRQRTATPLGRVGTPEDIVPAVLYFADEGALHTTGATLIVDAGFHLGPRPTSPDGSKGA